jgi:hypothetical protein
MMRFLPPTKLLTKWVALLIVMLGVFLTWYTQGLWNDSRRLDSCLVTWRKTGTQNLVDICVVNELGAPIAGEGVVVHNDSGGNSGITDAKGRVSIEVGEPTLDYIDIEKRGKINWPIKGLDVTHGLRFVIIIYK